MVRKRDVKILSVHHHLTVQLVSVKPRMMLVLTIINNRYSFNRIYNEVHFMLKFFREISRNFLFLGKNEYLIT